MATQRVQLYSDTVSSNIAYSAPDDISEDDVALYARLAAADFICSLPEGFDTIIGEQGTGLSGGQKQRIALARALAKQPEILILDDTTSAVDLETEKQLRKNLQELPYPCTKIIVAQRISAVRSADQILVLQDGASRSAAPMNSSRPVRAITATSACCRACRECPTRPRQTPRQRRCADHGKTEHLRRGRNAGKHFQLGNDPALLCVHPPEGRLFLRAFVLQALAMVAGLCGPLFSARVLDEAVPAGNIPMVLACCALMLACIAVNILFTTLSSRCVNVIGQNIVHDLRRDLYEHLQKLSFSYFDSRPHGKILVRVINYVNSVANILSNGLISLFLQMFNLVFIVIFMLRMDARLACVVLAGLPFAVGFILFIKPCSAEGGRRTPTKAAI